jgi:probable phosphoglycerate mutase
MLGGEQPYVLSSPRRRALDTARLAGFTPDEVTELAAEWDYGDFEGLTSAQIRASDPDWSIWSGHVPAGESGEQITQRIDALLRHIDELRATRDGRPVVVFSHGHASRCIAARWLGEPVSAGRAYWLTTAAASSLGHEHGRPVILRWNLDASLATASIEGPAGQAKEDMA